VDNLVEKAAQYLRESSRAVVMTGAGISTPSGIPDFRSPNSGLWTTHDPMSVATIQAFRSRPEDFYEWLHPLASLIIKAEPNPAHLALVDLERFGPIEAIVTQNIDMLHHHAGSEKVYEVHGHLRQAICMSCGYSTEANQIFREYVASRDIPRCELCDGILKPTVTLFGELPPMSVLHAAEAWAATCDLMIVAGTSLEVLPVADLPLLATQNGARLIIVNNTPTYADEMADIVFRAGVADILPQLAAQYKVSKLGA